MSSIELFSSFTREGLYSLFISGKYELKTYNKDQVIYLQNQVCDNIGIILEGRVSVQNIGESGNVLTIDTFLPRDMIGANLVFSSKNYYPMTVLAVVKAVVLHIRQELVLELCNSNQDFMVGLLKSISDRSIILTDKINTISLKTIRENIIDFLKYEHHIQKSKIIKLDISKKDLAERLGVQRTSLSRELNKMRKDGLLEYDANSITIITMDAFGSSITP